MNIYVLEAIVDITYDCYDGHVVVANNDLEARKQCSSGYEGKIWIDGEKSSIEHVGHYEGMEKEPFVLLSSFNAG